MASLASITTPEQLREVKRYVFVKKYGEKVLLLLYKYSFYDMHPRFQNSYDILDHYGKMCNQYIYNNYSMTYDQYFVKNFNQDQIRNLKGNLEDMDITLFRAIFKCLWDLRIKVNHRYVLNGELASWVRKISDERNSTVHEKQNDITQRDLEVIIESFQNTLESTLKEAKKFLRCHYMEINQLKDEIVDAVPKLLNPDDDQTLLDDTYWDQLSERIQQLAKEELSLGYDNLSKFRVAGVTWFESTDPKELMIPLKMGREKAFHRRWRDCASVDQKEILVTKAKDGKDPKAIIISGGAGSGKTTMFYSILDEWSKNTNDMPNLSSFQTLLYMQFRSQDYNSLDDYLKSCIPQAVSRFGLERVRSSIYQSKCLVLCDGYDEANDKSLNLFKEFLSKNFKDSKIVVTTRPVNTDILTDVVNETGCTRINLRVLSLCEEDKKLLIKKMTAYLFRDKTEMEALKSKLIQTIDGMDEEVKDFLDTPLYCSLFILLYTNNPKLMKRIVSKTTLYIELKEYTKKRIIERTGIQVKSLEDFDNIYHKLSFKIYKLRRYELHDKEIDDIKTEIQCQKVIENFDMIMSYYFNVKHKREAFGTKRVYCYTHASELEFAAAGKICEEIIYLESKDTVENVLVSNGFLYRVKPFRLLDNTLVPRDGFTDLFVFIIGIFYFKKTLYRIIDEIHDFLLKRLKQVDATFIPVIETRLDSFVFKSLVSIMKETSAKDKLLISDPKSYPALPQLLRKLKPKCLNIKFGPKLKLLPAQLFQEVLDCARQVSVFIHLQLTTYLGEPDELIGWSSPTVDRLDLTIHDISEGAIKETPFPISAKDLSIEYIGTRKTIQEIANIINNVWPRQSAETIPETMASRRSSSLQTRETDRAQVHQDPSLSVMATHIDIREEEIKLLLDSLDVSPLRRLTIHCHPLSSDEIREQLRNKCLDKGLGELVTEEREPFRFPCPNEDDGNRTDEYNTDDDDDDTDWDEDD